MRVITPEEAQTLLLVDPPIALIRLPSGVCVTHEGSKVDPKMGVPWVRASEGRPVYTEAEARAMIATAPLIRIGWAPRGRTMFLGDGFDGPRLRAVPIVDGEAKERSATLAILQGARPVDCTQGLDDWPNFCVRLSIDSQGMVCAQNEEEPGRGTGATIPEALAALAASFVSGVDEPYPTQDTP